MTELTNPEAIKQAHVSTLPTESELAQLAAWR
jgi:hypothetical protein